MRQPLPSIQDTQFESLRWSSEPEFFAPHATRSLPGVLPTLYAMLERPLSGWPTLEAWLPEVPRGRKRALLLCVDGMGFKEIGQSQALKSLWSQYGSWITSVFPSITSAALTSIYQAQPPGRHGLAGHHIWKNMPGALLDALRMQVLGASAPLEASGFDVNLWKREPGLLDLDEAYSGIEAIQLLPQGIVGTGLSHFAYGKLPLSGYAHEVEAFAKAARLLPQMRTGWVGIYTPTIDTLAHHWSGANSEVGLCLRWLEDCLKWLAQQLPPEIRRDTAVIVATDHGHADVKQHVDLDSEKLQWLQQNTRAVGHSGRVLHIYGPTSENDVKAWLAQLVGDAGHVFNFDDVSALAGVDTGADQAWREFARESLGDIVVVLRDGHNWRRPQKTPPTDPAPTQLVSQHGGLSWNEMVVPFIAAPLETLADL